ncbi:MAG: sulfurtransferase, partial [Flavobacteriaceae bacterium]|nr:sulfurtransferase [Flavobacteriaceae bacterium]
QCHQCGAPFDVHTNCANDACHLLFIQCDECKKKMKNCCSNKCLEITKMPHLLQKKLRKGQKNSNDIFKKGRTNNITTFNKNEL